MHLCTLRDHLDFAFIFNIFSKNYSSRRSLYPRGFRSTWNCFVFKLLKNFSINIWNHVWWLNKWKTKGRFTFLLKICNKIFYNIRMILGILKEQMEIESTSDSFLEKLQYNNLFLIQENLKHFRQLFLLLDSHSLILSNFLGSHSKVLLKSITHQYIL